MNGWSEWIDGWYRTIQWRKGSLWIAASQGLCHEPLTRANVANPTRSARARGRRTWRWTQTHTNTHTCTCFSHSLQSPLLYCSVPASLDATATQTILPMREQLPREGRRQRDLNAPKASGQSGLIFITVAMSFWTGNALKNKSWRTTWWYCVATKNCWN